MATGELLVRWTVRLALVCYAVVLAAQLAPDPPPRRQRLLRWTWTLGCLAYLAHVVSAFHFVHHWSHDAAYRETARRVAEWCGFCWGGGLYLNYLFTVAWVGDVAWWWCGLERYRNRPRWLDRALHGFLGFMVFNGAVVFAAGVLRWVSLGACLALGLLWLAAARWRTAHPRQERAP